MRHVFPAHRFLPAIFALTAAATLSAQTQQAATPAQHADHGAPTMSKAEIEAFAKVEVAIGTARDTAQARLAMVRNKKDETQKALRDSLSSQIAVILTKAGLTETEYRKRIYYVSSNGDARRVFDETVAKLTGAPLPGIIQAAAQTKVPAGDVGVHIGHIVNGFKDTPNGQSLMAVANAEARTAAQHAALAARNTASLDAMKLHAGHVINALDPGIVPMGPGLGYGLKKAAMAIAMHIDLAAKTAGASQNVIVHANHIGTSAKNTVTRSDAAIALAQRIQAATTAEEAAQILNQLVSLTAQLVAGADANGDGRIGWQENEGGLQQAEEHIKLLLAGENIPF